MEIKSEQSEIPYKYESYHGSRKLEFKPNLKPHKWVVTNIKDIYLFADDDICNPNTPIFIKANITIARMKWISNSYEDWLEDYKVLIDVDKETFKTSTDNKGKYYANEGEFLAIANVKEALDALKEQIIAGAKEKSFEMPEQTDDGFDMV